MSILHLLYVLICSISFASMDFLRKLLAGSIAPMVLVFFLSSGVVPPMLAWMVVEGSGEVSSGYLVPGLASVVLNLVANVAFVYSVKLSSLSRTIPMLSLTPVFTSLMAIPILSEYPSPRQTMGIASVVAAALILNLDRARDGSFPALVKALATEKGSLLMTGVALLWSVAAALDKKAISYASAPFHGTVLSVGVALGALLFLLHQQRSRELLSIRRSPWLVAALMVGASLALAFQLLAIQVVLVSLVETLKRAIGCFMAVLLDKVVFGETVTLHKTFAVSAMVLGVALVLA